MPENFDCCREINVQNEFRIEGFNLRYARICLDFARLDFVKRPDTAPDLIPGTSLTKNVVCICLYSTHTQMLGAT